MPVEALVELATDVILFILFSEEACAGLIVLIRKQTDTISMDKPHMSLNQFVKFCVVIFRILVYNDNDNNNKNK